jgi:hypothetical protein
MKRSARCALFEPRNIPLNGTYGRFFDRFGDDDSSFPGNICGSFMGGLDRIVWSFFSNLVVN